MNDGAVKGSAGSPQVTSAAASGHHRGKILQAEQDLTQIAIDVVLQFDTGPVQIEGLSLGQPNQLHPPPAFPLQDQRAVQKA